MRIEAKPCPECHGPASCELSCGFWTVRCTLSCPGTPEAEAMQRDTAILWWNRLVEEFEAEEVA